MPLYKSKPVQVAAIQFFNTCEGIARFHEFIGDVSFKMLTFGFWEHEDGRKFTTINRCMNIFDGDYIGKDKEHGWIHMNKEYFESRYDLA